LSVSFPSGEHLSLFFCPVYLLPCAKTIHMFHTFPPPQSGHLIWVELTPPHISRCSHDPLDEYMTRFYPITVNPSTFARGLGYLG
jgi:hypothetical protein